MKRHLRLNFYFYLLFIFSVPLMMSCAGTHKKMVSGETGISEKKEANLLKAIKTNANDNLAYFQLSKLSFQRADYAKALMFADSSLSKNPDYLPASVLKGKILCQLERYREACNTFVRVLERDEEGLYVREIGGTVGILYKISQLTKGEFNDAGPHFTPDGSRILFQSDRNGNWDIFSMNPLGGNIVPVVTDSMNQEDPVPSPTGDWVYYTQNQSVESKNRDIYRINLKSKEKGIVVSGLSDDWYPAPAPDGKWLFFVSNRLHPENDSLTTIFRLALNKDKPAKPLFSDGIYAAPAPVTSEKALLLTHKTNSYFHLYEANYSGKKLRAVGEESFNYGTPSVSPDGKNIVFYSNRHNNYDIYMKNVQTGSISRLTHFKGYDMNPVFSPDGSKIVFHSSRDGHFHLFEIDLNLPFSRGELLDQLRRLSTTLE